MAQKYYNVSEAAKLLGLTDEEVRKKQEQRELYGYRDGADWKFKAEDIEKLAAERMPSEQPATSEAAPVVQDSSEDILLSEVELGQSSISTGTVIGMESPGAKAPDSDLNLASGSEIGFNALSGSSMALKNFSDSASSPFEELDLTLEEDVNLEDSNIDIKVPKPGAESATGSSVVTGKPLEDDDLVIGSGSSGSGLTFGGDSGISLVDPHDSGLSLEEPLEISGSKAESLELGEDDQLAQGSSKKGPGSSVKGDDDFLLTPMEDAGDVEESESGSQVIALDTDNDDASTMIASSPVRSMGAMLEEDLGSTSALDFGSGVALSPSPLGGTPLGATTAAMSESAAVPSGAVMAEMPYTGLQITGLVLCLVPLMLCCMMMFDLVRNVWSWQGNYSINSSLMDMFRNIFGG